MRHYTEIGVEDLAIMFGVFGAVSVCCADNVVIPMDFVVTTRDGAFVDEYFPVLDKSPEAFNTAFNGLQLEFARV